MMAESKFEHYEWLLQARKKNQALLLELYKFGSNNHETSLCDAPRRTLFALFVGAGFSLWRAAFLSDTDRKWPNILRDANELLEKVVRDNAIAFKQDRDTQEWMGGYYINNAKFRLIEAREQLNEGDRSQFDFLEDSTKEGRELVVIWDELHGALVQMFALLQQATGGM